MKWLAYVWTSSIWTMSGTAAGWWLAVRGARPLLPGAPARAPEGSQNPEGASLVDLLGSRSEPPLALPTQALHLAYGAFGGFLILTLLARFASPLLLRPKGAPEEAATEFKRLDVDVRDLQNLLDERTNVLINRIGELRSDVVAGFAGLEMQGTVINEKLAGLEMQGAVINEKLGGLEVINEKLGGLEVINEKLGALWQLACRLPEAGPEVVPEGTQASSLWPKIVDIGIALAFAPFAGQSNLR